MGPYAAISHARTRRRAVRSATLWRFSLGRILTSRPSWYPSKRETGKVVPTWNYVAIHAYGTLEFIDDSDDTRSHVTELTRRFEHDRPVPWAPSDAPEDYIASMVRRIIGFRLTITRLEGKWKMSQNRPLEDRIGTANGLEEESKADIAALVRPPP
jgi:transcriptional regulator